MNRYLETVKQFIKTESFRMLKEGTGVFRHPFIDPGAGYAENLWDWDSYWSAFALMEIVDCFRDSPDFDYAARREQVIRHAKGNILNFFDLQHEDGFIAMVTTAEGLFADYLSSEHRKGNPVNQHKPFLCQGVANVSRYCGDYAWFDAEKLVAYLDFYERNQYDEQSQLFFWQNDLMIGIDNNPTVYGLPDRCGADIYLNCFLYREYCAMADLLGHLEDERAERYRERAACLKAAIRRELYDPRDGLYYSAFLDVHTHKSQYFNHGVGAFWHTVPLKIRIWACCLPMTCGISTPEENARMVKEHYLDPAFLCEYGIRTLAADEKMYNTQNSSNPSNWLGAVWIVASYCVFDGLMKCGYLELAKELADRTVTLLGKDIQANHRMSESYVPETGEPMMWGGFLNWNCLVGSMIKRLNW